MARASYLLGLVWQPLEAMPASPYHEPSLLDEVLLSPVSSNHSPETRFGDLRSLLQRAPSAQVWFELIELLEDWQEEDPNDFVRVALPYVCGHLDHWPDRLRQLPIDWFESWCEQRDEQDMERGAWRFTLARAFVAPELPHRDTARALVRGMTQSEWLEDATVLEMPRCYMRNLPIWMLARSSKLGRLEALDLSYNGLSVWSMHALQRAESLTAIERLSLDGNGLDARALMPLAARTDWRRLRALSLSSNALGDEGMEVLTSAPHFSRLRELSLAKNEIGDEGIQILANSAMYGSLECIDLANNNLGSRSCEALAAAPSLVELDLTGNTIDEFGGVSLVRSPYFGQWRRLGLANTGVAARTLEALAEHDAPLELRRLDLTGNQIAAAGASALARCRGLAKLESLELSVNALDVAAIRELSEAPFIPHLRHLSLSFNPLTDAGIAHMLTSSRLERLERLELHHCAIYGSVELPDELGWVVNDLDLDSNPFGDAFIEELASKSWMRSVRKLNLRRVRMTDRGAQALASSEHLASLEVLDLGDNWISGEGAAALIDGLPGLRELGLGGTNLDDAAARKLARQERASRLRALDVSWSTLSAHGAAVLRNSPFFKRCKVRVERILDDAPR